MQAFVMAEIAIYEYDCTGQSRKSDLITDAYKADSDARRQRKSSLRTTGPKVIWGAPMAPKRSTRESFEGFDFPTQPAAPDP
jgi:hypothetical protein